MANILKAFCESFGIPFPEEELAAKACTFHYDLYGSVHFHDHLEDASIEITAEIMQVTDSQLESLSFPFLQWNGGASAGSIGISSQDSGVILFSKCFCYENRTPRDLEIFLEKFFKRLLVLRKKIDDFLNQRTQTLWGE